MSTAFLTPALAGSPTARSPLADAASAAGARFAERDGWEIAVSFGDSAGEAAALTESVGFADLSHLTKVELQGDPAAIARALGPAEADSSTGGHLGLARRGEEGWRCPLAPSKALLLATPGQAPPELPELRGCDLTASLGAVSIRGPRAAETIARFCAIDTRPKALPVGGFRPGSVARTPGYLLREGFESFLILFGAAYGAYLWQVLEDAAAALGGRPVGLDALPRIERGEEALRA